MIKSAAEADLQPPNLHSKQDAYILDSLLGAPPVTLATRSKASSVFRSLSWVSKSAFDLVRSSWGLILATKKGTIHMQNKMPIQTARTSHTKPQNSVAR